MDQLKKMIGALNERGVRERELKRFIEKNLSIVKNAISKVRRACVCILTHTYTHIYIRLILHTHMRTQLLLFFYAYTHIFYTLTYT